jgi:hypothetical protein
MNAKIEMSREQKQYVANAILNGEKFDRYLLTFGIIHQVDQFVCFEMVEDKLYWPGTEIEIDLNRVQCRIRFCLPRIDPNLCQP